MQGRGGGREREAEGGGTKAIEELCNWTVPSPESMKPSTRMRSNSSFDLSTRRGKRECQLKCEFVNKDMSWGYICKINNLQNNTLRNKQELARLRDPQPLSLDFRKEAWIRGQ